jgi:cysteine-rich repeat protein
VFVRSGGVWTEQAKLVPADGVEGNGFGWAVALDGDTAIVAAPEDSFGGFLAGAAYVFVRSGSTWTQQAKLLPADGAAGDSFGRSALDGDTAIIAAAGVDANGENSGAAYVFTRTGDAWTEQAKLLASDGIADDLFGRYLALDGGAAVIAAPGHDWNGTDSGSVYVFARTAGGWTEQAKLLADDGVLEDEFGTGVAFDGDTAVFGAHYDDDLGLNSGSAYVFRLVIPVCGDGNLDPDTGEECDDGNNVDGDGCAADCTLEHEVPATTGVGVLVLVLALGAAATRALRRKTAT